MKQNPAIIIMAKVPRIGTVKTRLLPVLNELQCVELSICFLQDAVKKAKTISSNVIVAFSPPDGKNELETLLQENVLLTEQRGTDLGERMQSAFEFAENKGFSPMIMIGTDSPNFPPEFLQMAIDAFENEGTKCVLGGTKDGGYYLIGLRNRTDGLFANVEWSSENTFRQTAENALRLFGSEPFQIPDRFDVDTPADLKKLLQEYLENKDFRKIAPNTTEWLENRGTLFMSVF
jgi:uncharacterized protein